MKRIVQFLLIGAIVLGYNTVKAQSENKDIIKAVQIIKIGSFTIEPFNNGDTVVYFFRNDTILIRTAYANVASFSTVDDEEKDSTVTTICYRYFRFKKGEARGIWFEDYQISEDKFHVTDSVSKVMRDNTPSSDISFESYLRDSTTFLESRSDGQTLHQKYAIISHKHLKGTDTVSLTLSQEFNNLDFLLLGMKPDKDKRVLSGVSWVIHCDEALQYTMPEMTQIHIGIYLQKVAPDAIVEASKYFAIKK